MVNGMIPLYKPHMPELPELDSILHSGHLAAGEYTSRFENALKEFFGTSYIIVTNSFNTAISVAVTTLGLNIGDEVMLSPMGCLASTQPYISGGLKPIWSDIDNHTGTLDPDSVRRRITPRTKLIVHNHFCGYPGYVDEINTIGREYGIPIIDDGIECFGSEYKGRKIGAPGGADAVVLSFNPVRIPNTVDGGAVVFRDQETYEKSLCIQDCGIDRGIFRDDIGELSLTCDISLTGFSATMSNVNAYIGYRQMEYINEIIEKHRQQAKKWDTAFEGCGVYTPISRKATNPNFWVYGILSDNKRKAIEHFREKGYYASGVHINNNRYSVFGYYESLAGVEDFNSRFVALPCGWWMEQP